MFVRSHHELFQVNAQKKSELRQVNVQKLKKTTALKRQLALKHGFWWEKRQRKAAGSLTFDKFDPFFFSLRRCDASCRARCSDVTSALSLASCR